MALSHAITIGNEYADDADGQGNEPKESSTSVAATTAAISWTRSESTSSCRSDWRIPEGNEDGREMDSSYASARMEILDLERKRIVWLQGLVGEVQWLVESHP